MLNNAFQYNYFDAVTLAEIGQDLDELERQTVEPTGDAGRQGQVVMVTLLYLTYY